MILAVRFWIFCSLFRVVAQWIAIIKMGQHHSWSKMFGTVRCKMFPYWRDVMKVKWGCLTLSWYLIVHTKMFIKHHSKVFDIVCSFNRNSVAQNIIKVALLKLVRASNVVITKCNKLLQIWLCPGKHPDNLANAEQRLVCYYKCA